MSNSRSSSSGPFTELVLTQTIDFASVAAASAPDQAITVTGTLVGDWVTAVPLGTWPAGLAIPQGRCLVAGTVQFRLVNPTAASVDPGSQSFSLHIQRA